MNYRFSELLALTTISADGTQTIDLDMSDPISQIHLDLRATNGAGADSDGHPAESVTKIEIIDGSEVLFNLTGMCAQALDIAESGIHPRGGWYNYLVTTETDFVVCINFGRWELDPEYAFDPKQFRNPQLRITHDISAGGMNPSACKISVLATLFDEKIISPKGFLQTKEIKSYSATTGEHEYTDLPLDMPYRKILLQGLKREAPPHWVFSNIKLSEDQDKRVIFDNEFRDLLFSYARKNAFVEETWTLGGAITSQLDMHVTPTMDVMATGTSWTQTLGAKDIALYNGDGGYLERLTEVAANMVVNVRGWSPHACIVLPMGNQDDPADWYNVARVGNLKLDVTGGQTTTTSKVCVQQERLY